jgi:hypothetical protein
MAFDSDLDETTGVSPKKKTPQEMVQNPNDLLDPSEGEIKEKQKQLDDTWAVAEGGGPHESGINDNDSRNSPKRNVEP